MAGVRGPGEGSLLMKSLGGFSGLGSCTPVVVWMFGIWGLRNNPFNRERGSEGSAGSNDSSSGWPELLALKSVSSNPSPAR